MDPVRFEFAIHDRYQFQIKFNFPLKADEGKKRIRVESFLFLPASLDINAETYTRDYFYRDFSSLTRYEVPSLSLEQMLDPQLEISPLNRIAIHAKELQAARESHRAEIRQKIQYELRVLGCIVRERAIEQLSVVEERWEPPSGRGTWRTSWLKESVELIQTWLDQAEAVEKKIRALKTVCVAADANRAVTEAFEYIDEWNSILIQRSSARISKLLERARTHGAEFDDQGLGKRLSTLYEAEDTHRQQCGYPSVLEAEKGALSQRMNEHLIYRQELLRNYCHDVLMLATFVQQGSKSMQALLNAMAAMTAMIVFLVVVYLVQRRLPSDGLLYIALPVLAYAIKDRVKDALKLAFARRASGLLRDHEVELLDRRSTPLNVGKAFEVFNFIPYKSLPTDVRTIRARSSIAELSDAGRPEQVLRHEKEILLYSDRVFKRHKRVDNLCEKYRWSVRHLLFRMDEPLERVEVLRDDSENPGALIPRTVHARKVYHANLVLKISVQEHDGKWNSQLRKYRLILSREGIVRYEIAEQTIGPGHAPSYEKQVNF